MSGFQLNIPAFRTHYNNLCAQWHELDAQVKTLEAEVSKATDMSQGSAAGVFVNVVAAKKGAASDAKGQLAVTRAQQAQLSRFLDAARKAFVDYGTSQEESALRLLRAAAVDSDPMVGAAAGIAAVGGMAGVVAGVEEAGLVTALGGSDAGSQARASSSEGTASGSESKGSFNVGSIGLSD